MPPARTISKLTTVYSAWWFLLILAVLVVSTSLCIARNTPKILHDLCSRPNVSEAVVLSTCNRTEVYAVADRFHGAYQDVRDVLSELSHLAPSVEGRDGTCEGSRRKGENQPQRDARPEGRGLDV